MPGLFSYCSGHITQLFIFCVLGEEITCAVGNGVKISLVVVSIRIL